MKPYLPVNSLRPSGSKIDDSSITKLSFPMYYQSCKRSPILPHRRSMLGKGSMQDFTTQKHDYVAKPPCKRNAIIHETNIKSNDSPLESETVQKLSFAPPDAKSLSVAKSCRPLYTYKRPNIPMEEMTTHKLSFIPSSPQKKDELPWVNKVHIKVSAEPIQQFTTYKLSYIPNPRPQKLQPLRAKDNEGLVTAAQAFDDHTIYKQSFFLPEGCFKRTPILPTLQLTTSDAKLNADSVYNLSYPSHEGVQRSSPILPHSRRLLGTGPLDDLTTQKRDFVDKPLCRREPIVPTCQMQTADSPIEKQTTTKLSYMQPNGLTRSIPFRPKDSVTRPEGPMDSTTIHKMSFVPIVPPEKMEYPWMQRKLHTSELPIDFKTTQSLSFMPPGGLVKSEIGCICSCDGECVENEFPKADSF
ncbi:Stabilizer of axonemal microtubules 1 [Pseudolycoriella hygida]|uniref:Stabilizer of axonemal microtubules 1 n=1 Tax=Pseudolycoriella hygida TaxID=35572 RepID=A0A9Q0MJT6_9DIPT|nr:Stabilizer of axonemal microtubules 1 [Pseudolycoriella hygida]